MITIIPNPSPLIAPLFTANPQSSFDSPLTSPFRRRRRRFQLRASSLVLPLLPFPIDQVLIPSEVKSLRLYEARYIALLEEVEKLEIGALVLIRGGGRVKLLEFKKAQPYLTGEVTPMQDNVPLDMTEINSEVLKLKEVLHNLNRLEIKLKTLREALLQTQITNSLVWAEKQITLDCIKDFVPSVAERVSFAEPPLVASLPQLLESA